MPKQESSPDQLQLALPTNTMEDLSMESVAAETESCELVPRSLVHLSSFVESYFETKTSFCPIIVVPWGPVRMVDPETSKPPE